MTLNKAVAYFIIVFGLFISTSCEGNRRTALLQAQFSEVYIKQFKLTYFRQLLAKSYNHSQAVTEIISADHSGFTEPVLTSADYKLIDSLTSIDHQYLVADSSEGRNRAEGAQGKRPLGYIMEKLAGKWLDSLARRRLKLNGAENSWVH